MRLTAAEYQAYLARTAARDPATAADDGRTFWIEAKTRAGKLTTEQRAALAWLNKLGHRHGVVRSLREFLEMVEREETI